MSMVKVDQLYNDSSFKTKTMSSSIKKVQGNNDRQDVAATTTSTTSIVARSTSLPPVSSPTSPTFVTTLSPLSPSSTSSSSSKKKFLVKQQQLEHLLLSTSSKYGLSPRSIGGGGGGGGGTTKRNNIHQESTTIGASSSNVLFQSLSLPNFSRTTRLSNSLLEGVDGESKQKEEEEKMKEEERKKELIDVGEIPMITAATTEGAVLGTWRSCVVNGFSNKRMENEDRHKETAHRDDDDGRHYVEMTQLEEENGIDHRDDNNVNIANKFKKVSNSIGWGRQRRRRQKLRKITTQESCGENDLLRIQQQIQQTRRKNCILYDKVENMTWSRRLALQFRTESWYNPNYSPESEEYRTKLLLQRSSNNNDFVHDGRPEHRPPKVTRLTIPSLETAWAYHEHFALPRYIANDPDNGEAEKKEGEECTSSSSSSSSPPFSQLWNAQPLQRAEPGEADVPTRLYDPIVTPLSQMGDFGLGIGLYFATLLALAVLTLIAGLVNVPNILYFASDEYSDGQTTITNPLLKGSAICTRTKWVPCIDCNFTTQDFAQDRFYSYSLSSGNNDDDDYVHGSSFITFALKNDCDGATIQQGLINYCTMFVMLIGIVFLNRYQKKMQVKFDEDEQTAQDYSIRIKNPPGDAADPDEWKRYFLRSFDAHTTVITTALDNDNLVNALRERRECLRNIELMVEPGTSMDHSTLARMSAEIQQSRTAFQRFAALFLPELPELFRRKAELEAMIVGWAQLDYPCSNVFVSFETEAEQRHVLTALNLGKFDIHRNATHKVSDSRHLFRDYLVLEVSEPDEPNTIRWQDLNIKFVDKLQPVITTTISCAIIVAGIELLIRHIHKRSVMYSATAIAFFNVLFPMVAKALTNLERHSSENQTQTSLYFKIAAFRWVNTAIIISIITPFTHTLEGTTGEIPSIYAIFFAEIVTTNLIQVSDLYGLFQRHILAPRAKSQDAMNLLMLGEEVELAERYTNMTKIVFLGLWYCSIYPLGLFLCSFALFVNYFTDRYSLMRTWKRLPNLGTRIAEFSLCYFMPSAIVAMAVVSTYFWSGFPFDNLCPYDGRIPYKYKGSHTFELNGEQVSLTLTSDDVAYRYCSQDFLGHELKHHFPPFSFWQPEGDEWMSSSQERMVNVFAVTSIVVLLCVLWFFVYQAYNKMKKYFIGKYEPVGEDQRINYSDVKSISAYVPQVNSSVYSYPLLACDVTNVDPKVIGWTDPDRYHTYYDLTEDARELIGTSDQSMKDKKVFSRLAHYPPLNRKGQMADHKFV